MSHIPFGKVRAWVFQSALPFWTAHGVDAEYGGFLEEVSPAGAPTDAPFKRVRVMARQLYAFSHGALMGYAPARDVSSMGYEYLVAKAQLSDGGWAKQLSRKGALVDATPDLYDLAFVLFALAWRYRLTGEAEPLRLAHKTLDFVQQRMRAIEGFWPTLPFKGVELQNPHMHLLEACLGAFEATQDERFLAQADELTKLFRERLFDGRTLGERFRPDWASRIDGDPGRALEPGHHFEWAWILARYTALRGVDLGREASALVDFAERFGVDRVSHAVFDAVRDDGVPLKRSSRAWTNTERIKGWLGVYELSGRDPRPAVASATNLLFDRYFAGVTPGAWVDQLDGDGAPMVETVPASIVYHLLLAFAEMLRLGPALVALDQREPLTGTAARPGIQGS